MFQYEVLYLHIFFLVLHFFPFNFLVNMNLYLFACHNLPSHRTNFFQHSHSNLFSTTKEGWADCDTGGCGAGGRMIIPKCVYCC